MPKSCNIAFKEWSVIVQALLEGRQTLILRKGGISEKEGRFTIESEEFLLYPTKVHQAPESMIDGVDNQQLIAAAQDQIASDHVKLRAFARVEHYERVRDMERIKALRPYHIWSDSIIDQRFHWGNEDWLDVFVLQVSCLSVPIELKNDSSFAGCKSWIHLAQPLSVEGAVAAKATAALKEEVQRIRTALGSTAAHA